MNGSLAEMLGTTPGTVSRWVSQLEQAGYVRRVLNKASGNRDRKLYAIAPIRIDQQTPSLMDEETSVDTEEEGYLTEVESILDTQGEGLSMDDEQSNRVKNRKSTQNLDRGGSSAPASDDVLDIAWNVIKAEAEEIILSGSTIENLSIEQRSKILLWFFAELRGRWVLETRKVLFKFTVILKTVPFENIVEAIWICEHNKYHMAETDRKQTKWTLTWLLDKSEIHIDDVLSSDQVNIEPNKKHMEIRKKIPHLVPIEFLRLPKNSEFQD